MCGTFALFHPGKAIQEKTLEKALDSLRHRGPDDRGLWSDSEQGIALAQTRLAILDTSAAGHQPMVSASGRFVISFNGEIYNHRDIRAALGCTQGTTAEIHGGAIPNWRGHSDTETLLAAIERWGVQAALDKAAGMFAFVLWDRDRRELHLARDRVGEKPLYYGYAGGTFAAASEARSFRILPEFSGRIDQRSLALMMQFLAVPAPGCIFEGFASLLPGCYLTINARQVARRELPEPKVYWSASAQAGHCATQPHGFQSDGEAVDALERCLTSAVERQMISDVPLGAFLSGGIDSSTVVALMQAQARRTGGDPVQTFSIGFNQSDYNEAHHAKRVAAHLGTRHTELYVSNAESLALVPRLAQIYDEPFADSSQIGVYLVSRMARQSVTVALTGDGSDELFGGYRRYIQGASWWRRSRRIPQSWRGSSRSLLTRIPAVAADRLADSLSRLLPGSMRIPRPSHRLEKLANMLASQDARQLYAGLAGHWRAAEIMRAPAGAGVQAGTPWPGASTAWPDIEAPWPGLASVEEQMMMMDLSFILPTALLTKVDRAAMSVSLETRAPFLDPAVMAFAWKLPLDKKIRGGEGKWLLRQLLYRHVPASLVDRPKMGFEVPVAHWLRGALRPWAEALLDEARLQQEGLFNVAAIRTCWSEHIAGVRNHASKLWAVLMFQSWHETNRSPHLIGR